MNAVDRFMDRLMKVLSWLLVAFGVAMVILTFLSALVRKLGFAIPWGDEITRYLFIYATYIGSVVALYKGRHMMVDVLVDVSKGVFRFVLLTFSDLVMLAFSILLVYGGIKMLGVASVDSSPILNIPLPYIYISLPVSGVLMAVICVLFLTERIIRFAKAPKGFTDREGGLS